MTQSRNTQKPIQNYLRAYLTALGLTYERAGELVGVPPNGLSRPANGDRKLQIEIALPLWESFGFPPEDVGFLFKKPPTLEYFRKHNVEWKGPIPDVHHGPGVNAVRMRQIDVIGFVQAGVFSDSLEWDSSDRYLATFPIDDGYPKEAPRYALEVKGESMNRVFPHGSLVSVIDFEVLGRPPETGDYVVVIRRDTYSPGFEVTIKAVQICDDGSVCLWPQSTNPSFQQPIILPELNNDSSDHAEKHSIEIKGLVVGMTRTRIRATF